MMPYRGRFAPSPTGPLHAGSLVAALASWLDAKAHQGQWWVRMEDTDGPRCPNGTDQLILQQLAQCHLHPDAPVQWQSRRTHLYQAALEHLRHNGLIYPCICSRKDTVQALSAQGWAFQRHASLPYPGTCRQHPPSAAQISAQPHSWRFAMPSGTWHWQDRWLGSQSQNMAQAVGDVVLRRADGLWAYQLAVVVDDAEQGITHVVRGQDLADNTPRQIALQQALRLSTPTYMHTPLVRAEDGEKLSKQNGAHPLDTRDPLKCLQSAAQVLGLDQHPGPVPQALAHWVGQWTAQHGTTNSQAETP
ncbi:MAG: tRNA glutamyl-Q(34) synthetase GluQRS [Betaproteobacteria bacterium]|nr:tRNA glutamyl-Q(34) synthetase GluQRS [Betaproteobacteria bacterium]NBY04354.1 tRNA glutamyl-Q(34) synthetase GluQRS [Betaproteobacteria bacterium]